ncbi:MAG: HEAT repeat domain-containing protein [Gemmatimonadota bacterium]|nr:HEAT repeat domain-containing protein [Gemmatimonadota bacterium]
MTSPTIAPPELTLDELPDPPCPPQLVEEMLRNFARAIKTHQLYLPNNPMYARAIDNLRAAFAPIWPHSPEIVLAITESDFKWFGRSVMHEANRSESVPWVFFKDGVRELTLTQGIEDDELTSLLYIMQRVRNAAPEEDDLLTLLWEQEFTRLKYRFVDINLDSHASFDASAEPPKERSIPIIDDIRAEEAAEPERKSGIVRMEDLDATLYFLDEKEIDYLRGAVAADQTIDMPRNVLAILLDIFEVQESEKVREEICGILESYMLNLLAAGAYGSVAYLLAETDLLIKRAVALTPAHRSRLLALPTSLSDPSVLSQLLEALDQSEVIPEQAELDALFDQLRGGVLGTVLGWLKQAQKPELRTALERVAARMASSNSAEMMKLIGSSDPSVAIEAMRRAGELKTAAAVAPLSKVLHQKNIVLRQAAAQTLSEIGSPGAMRLLETALDDDDRDVRISAVRALGLRGHRAALPRVEAVVRGKTVKGADLTEKMAYFEAYGVLAKDAGIPPLDKLLNKRGFWGRRASPELRACAARALGMIGSANALDVLRRAQRERDPMVRSSINRAMREKT